LDIQVEHLDNHTARLVVNLEPERLTAAMDKAARRIGQKVSIPGFRKGKAPVQVVLKWVGQQNIMEEAMEELGNEVYRSALEESKIEPYAPGSLEDVKTEPSLTLTFSVPKRPEIKVGAYRDIRLPFDAPTVEDKNVDETIKQMQDARAVVEPADRPAAMSDMLKVKLFGEITHPAHEHSHGEEAHKHAEEGDKPEAAESEEKHEHEEGHKEVFVDQEIDLVLTEDKERDIVPGFAEHLVGLKSGEEKVFSIAFPEDYEDKRVAGHSYDFKATVQEIKSRTLPTLNDDFAKLVSEGETQTLLELRVQVRKDLQKMAERDAETKYADEVLNKILETAEIRYPEAMVEEYTDQILKELDENLKERGLSLQRAMQIQNKDNAAMRADYRDAAISRIRRGLLLRQLVEDEQLTITDTELDHRVDEMAKNFSADPKEAAQFRRMLNRPETRRNIEFDLVMSRLMNRLAAIAKGDNPPLGPDPEPAAETPAEPAENAPEGNVSSAS